MKNYHLFLTLIMMAAVGLVCRSCRSVHLNKSLRDSSAVAVERVYRDSFSAQTLASLAKVSNQKLKVTLRNIHTSIDSTGHEVTETEEMILETDSTERTDSATETKTDGLTVESDESSGTTVAESESVRDREPPNRWPGIIMLAIIAFVVTYNRLYRHS